MMGIIFVPTEKRKHGARINSKSKILSKRLSGESKARNVSAAQAEVCIEKLNGDGFFVHYSAVQYM